mmetsp:Transcript_5625/g.8657  ORF Transcript_5625/g.8657 Transcript_5625/m.8657 type:complete len:350 (-) Transcript_5625:58-1107(-)|eukprot:CAMPEP_0195282846 /NCGR_PEP_ID=MMETSP0707-20130614/1587_1 /TAXON_ID=33640 /ORGANISM="Asterionellopsis glacialis, Strain CCMP134" /LENGTH=349 /DNA_ID=CAMNT_0040341903 /DNA_START=47 /DNA_END=1096 /DNA_ORIENTATION=+
MDSLETISTPPQPQLQGHEEDDDDDEDHHTVDIQRNLDDQADDDDEDGNSPTAGPGTGDDEEEDEVEEDEEEEEEGEETTTNGDGGTSDNTQALSVRATPTLDSLSELREIGYEAICWTLSTAKPGNGVEQLQDNSQDTYWQSDGSQPHLLQIQFQRRVAVSHVCLYLDYNLDESYTPKRLSVQVGMTTQDLQTGVFPSVVDLHEPVGWCIIPLTASPDPLDDPEEDEEEEEKVDDDDENEDGDKKQKRLQHKRLVRTYLVQVAILSMHQNGRDTHVRQVKLFGPRRTDTAVAAAAAATTNSMSSEKHPMNDDGSGGKRGSSRPVVIEPFTPWNTNFATVEVSQFSTIR